VLSRLPIPGPNSSSENARNNGGAWLSKLSAEVDSSMRAPYLRSHVRDFVERTPCKDTWRIRHACTSAPKRRRRLHWEWYVEASQAAYEGSIPFARSSYFQRHSRHNLNPASICVVPLSGGPRLSIFGRGPLTSSFQAAAELAALPSGMTPNLIARRIWWLKVVGGRRVLRRVYSCP
jgi:hypothetical protein